MALSITPASVVPSSTAVLENITAGETITAGMAYYQKESDLKAYKASAVSGTVSAANLALTKVRGIAANSASAGQPLTGVRYDPALAIGATVVQGETYALDWSTAGVLTTTTDLLDNLPRYHKVVCQANSTTTVYVDLRNPAVGVHAPGA